MSVKPTYEELQGRVAALENEVAVCRRMQQAVLTGSSQLLDALKRFPAYVCMEAPDHTFRYANDLFRERFGDPAGRTCIEVFGDDAPPCPAPDIVRDMEPRTWEWRHAPEKTTYLVHAYPFPGGGQGEPLVLELGLDVTLPQLADQDRLLLVEELQQVTAQMKLLQGVVPVCSCCRRLRNDEPYWRRLEEYLARKASVPFAAGLCQACRERYFPRLEG
ncbi:MAG: hypothetical protein M0017_00745 [Desulfobacteraceae bacterium]|nr:hypothetical protein [Desulfobacteraceae bacterium]